MVPVIAPVHPHILKTILEKYGFSVKRDTETNWTLFKANSSCPVIVLPKKGKLVSITTMMGILDQLKMNDREYFSLLKQIKNEARFQ